MRAERAEESVRLAHAAGVAIATGTDFGGGSTRANQLAWEVESLVAAGLEPWEALGAATWRGGELLGEPEAGVIREGGPADFALVHGDPTSDPAALWRVSPPHCRSLERRPGLDTSSRAAATIDRDTRDEVIHG